MQNSCNLTEVSRLGGSWANMVEKQPFCVLRPHKPSHSSAYGCKISLISGKFSRNLNARLLGLAVSHLSHKSASESKRNGRNDRNAFFANRNDRKWSRRHSLIEAISRGSFDVTPAPRVLADPNVDRAKYIAGFTQPGAPLLVEPCTI